MAAVGAKKAVTNLCENEELLEKLGIGQNIGGLAV